MKIFRNNSIFTILILALVLMSCKDAPSSTSEETTLETYQTQTTVTVISPAEFSKHIGAVSDVQLVDVRTPEEVAQASIAGATNIDINGAGFEENIAKLNKSQPVYVYCRSGGRSARAAAILKKAGFTEVYDLQGGITAWQAAGMEVVQ